jgi:hypothetical protein
MARCVRKKVRASQHQHGVPPMLPGRYDDSRGFTTWGHDALGYKFSRGSVPPTRRPSSLQLVVGGAYSRCGMDKDVLMAKGTGEFARAS